MFCRLCGMTLPDDSAFCHSCGKSLATTTHQASPTIAAAPAPAPIPAPSLERQARISGVRMGVLLGILLTLVIVWWAVNPSRSSNSQRAAPMRPKGPLPQPREMTVVDTVFTLNAAQGMHWNFTVPASATDVRVEGTFAANGGSGDGVEVYLLNDDEFVNWRNGHSVHTLYNSGRMTQGTLNSVLSSGAGTYHLVFNNKFSPFSRKAVWASIRLHYTL